MSAISDMIRETFKKGDDIRDAGLTTPPDIIRFDDILYGEDPKWQSLDVYRPKNAGQDRLPVIVSVHGGGWVYGDKERYQFYCMSLTQRGFAVVNFTYRLAPEYQYPAPLEDTNSVFTWVLSHAEEYGFDTEHIFAVGDSAGAHILGLYCAACTNPEYASCYTFHIPDSFVPTAVALNCGTYRIDMSSNDGENLSGKLMEDFLPEKGSASELERIDVLSHITEHFPPVFCITATGDFLTDQAALLADRLAACRVPFIYRFYGDAEHELGHVFHCNIKTPYAQLCNDEECSFFRGFCN